MLGQEALAATEKTARRQNALILFEERVGRAAAAVGAGHLGTQRPDARAAAPLRVKAAVVGWWAGIRAGWQCWAGRSVVVTRD
jgi:hypothetical protein